MAGRIAVVYRMSILSASSNFQGYQIRMLGTEEFAGMFSRTAAVLYRSTANAKAFHLLRGLGRLEGHPRFIEKENSTCQPASTDDVVI